MPEFARPFTKKKTKKVSRNFIYASNQRNNDFQTKLLIKQFQNKLGQEFVMIVVRGWAQNWCWRFLHKSALTPRKRDS
jgi:hypothetical protein